MTRPRSAGDPGALLPLWELQQTARVAARCLEQVLQQARITTSEYGVLACVSDEPGLTQAETARQLQVRPQALSATIARLRRRGFIHGSAPGRGKPSPLQITDTGRAVLDAAWPLILELNSPDTLGIAGRAAVDLSYQLRHVRQRLAETIDGGRAQTERAQPPR